MMDKIKETLHMGSSAARATGGMYVIKVYRAHKGETRELENVLKTHWDSLHAAGLTTERLPLILRSKSGQILEVFEWKDKSCVDRAHQTESLKAGWESIKSLADIVPLNTVAEAKDPYATFVGVDVGAHKDLASAASIVAKKPHSGKENDVLGLLKEHDAALRSEGLISDRPPMHMRGQAAGHVVEVHEWKKPENAQAALKSERVSSVWQTFHSLSDIVTLEHLPDAAEKYATFDSLDVGAMGPSPSEGSKTHEQASSSSSSSSEGVMGKMGMGSDTSGMTMKL